MMKPVKSTTALLAAASLMLVLAGCEKRDETTGAGPAERAGQQLDQAAARAGEELNQIAGKAGQGMQQMGEKLQNKAEEAQKKE